jgi:hypothetical protein
MVIIFLCLGLLKHWSEGTYCLTFSSENRVFYIIQYFEADSLMLK